MFIYFYTNSLDCFLQICFNYWHKKNELEADAFAISLGYAKELESSLIKLSAADLNLIFELDLDLIVNSTHPGLL